MDAAKCLEILSMRGNIHDPSCIHTPIEQEEHKEEQGAYFCHFLRLAFH